jgi:very-short-patch-repair endonuclease
VTCGYENRSIPLRRSGENIKFAIETAHANIRVIGEPNGMLKPASLSCSKCGHNWSARPANVLGKNDEAKHGCPICKASRGEHRVATFLQNAGLSYKRQKKFEDCRRVRTLSFDFFVPSLRTLIEFQGKQHFGVVSCFKERDKHSPEQSYILRVLRDLIKRRWVRTSGYTLIEIRYDEDVEKVLSERLNLSEAA